MTIYNLIIVNSTVSYCFNLILFIFSIGVGMPAISMPVTGIAAAGMSVAEAIYLNYP